MGIIPGSRIVWRIMVEHYHKRQELKDEHLIPRKVRTIIVGAGAGGSLFIKSLEGNNLGIDIIGIVDDEKSKQGMYVYDVPVLGEISALPDLVKKHHVEQITIAIPSLNKKELERIVELAQQTKIKINKMPSVEKVMTGKYKIDEFQEIDVVDLLGRDEVKLDRYGANW